MKRIFSVLVILFLTGCASTNDNDVQIFKEQTAQQQAIIKYQKALAAKPTTEIKCTGGCTVKTFDPSKLPLIPIDHYVGPHEANTKMVNSIMSNLVPIVGIVGAVRILDDAFSAVGSGSNISNTSTINGDDNNISPTTDLTNSTNTSFSTIGDSATRTFTDNSAIDNSTTDNSTVDSHDATAKPTIVKPGVYTVEPSYPPSN